MQARFNLVELGDLDFTVPAAMAITAALLAGRARRCAWRWCLLFGAGMLVVGLSKIAFMAWGIGIERFAFKAFSGHAAGATAVLPLLIYLSALALLALVRPAGTGAVSSSGAARQRQYPRITRQAIWYASLACGLALGLLIAVELVMRCHHTVSEALAGCAIGAAISVAVFFRSRAAACLRPAVAAAWFGAAFTLFAYLMNFIHVSYWMIKAARMLTQGALLHSLSID